MIFKKRTKFTPSVPQSKIESLTNRRSSILSVFTTILSELKNVNTDLKQCVVEFETEIARLESDKSIVINMSAENQVVIDNIERIVGK